jgi:hypothetical protein
VYREQSVLPRRQGTVAVSVGVLVTFFGVKETFLVLVRRFLSTRLTKKYGLFEETDPLLLIPLSTIYCCMFGTDIN